MIKLIIEKKGIRILLISIIVAGVILSLLQISGILMPGMNKTLSNPMTDKDGNTVYDCVYFGNYWQEDTNGDGITNKQDEKTPIKWRVLSVDGDDAFLVADQILDYQVYNNTDENEDVDEYEDEDIDIYEDVTWETVTWETCTMRSWLNGYDEEDNICEKDYTDDGDSFISNAFTADEQDAILATTIENEDNPYYDTEGGNDTTDKIFLLSLEDMTKSKYGFSNFDFDDEDYDPVGKEYYINDEDKEDYCDIYDYAKLRMVTAFAGGLDCGDQDELDTATGEGGCQWIGTSYWWLRSPGYFSDHATYVDSDGYVGYYGDNVSSSDSGVVPALHLNLSSSKVWRKAKKVTCKSGSYGGK